MVLAGDGEYVLPVPNAVPPEDAAYQLTVPADAVALNVTVPVLAHLAPLVVPVIVPPLTVTVAAVEIFV